MLILAFLKYSSYICNEITNQETLNMENLNERAANYAALMMGVAAKADSELDRPFIGTKEMNIK